MRREEGSGQAAPNADNTPAPAGMPASGNPAQGNQLSANVRAQAQQAAQPTLNSLQSTQQGRGLESNQPDQAPQWKEQSSTPAQETQKAGQAFQKAGVQADKGGNAVPGRNETTTPADQGKQDEMKNVLDNAGKNGQNNPLSRTEQAHEQAKEDQSKGAGQETPSQSQGWEK